MADHALATITNPSSALTDFSLLIDLSLMPSEWWSTVNTSDGTRGRVFKGDGTTQLACDWIDFDNSGQTGLLRVLWAGTLASTGTQQLWIEPPIAANASVAASDTYGQYNAYDSSWEGYWPDLGTDRTSNANDGSPINGATIGDASGLLGSATTLGGGSNYRVDVSGFDVTSGAWTVISLTYLTSYSSTLRMILSAPTAANHGMFVRASSGAGLTFNWGGIDAYDWAGRVAYGLTEWQVAGLRMNSGAMTVYVGDSTALASNTNTNTYGSSQATGLTFGGAPLTSLYWQGLEQHNQIHSVDRGGDWVDIEYQQLIDNSTFWGTPTWVSGGGGTTFNVTCSDSISYSDVDDRYFVFNSVCADITNMSDSISNRMTIGVLVFDAFNNSDAISNNIVMSQYVSDGVLNIDTQQGQSILPIAIVDSTTLSDSAIGELLGTINVICSDGIYLTDSLANTMIMNNTVTDGLNASDTDSGIRNIFSTVEDIFLSSDNSSVLLTFNISIDDTVVLSDSANSIFNFLVSSVDSIVASDLSLQTSFTIFDVTISDTILSVDSSTANASFSTNISDGVSISDVLTALFQFNSVLGDSVEISDIIIDSSIFATGAVSISATVKLLDATAVVKLLGVTATIKDI